MADSAPLELDQRQSEQEEGAGEYPQQTQTQPAFDEASPVDAHLEEAPRPKQGEDKLSQFLESKWNDIQEAALDLLRKLLQVDTQNFQDDGTEIKAVSIIKEKFEEAGITNRIIEPKKGRGNIVARITGDGSSGKGAILPRRFAGDPTCHCS